MELALQVKVGEVASFVGKIFVVRPPTTKTTKIFPTKITRYTVDERKKRGLPRFWRIN